MVNARENSRKNQHKQKIQGLLRLTLDPGLINSILGSIPSVLALLGGGVAVLRQNRKHTDEVIASLNKTVESSWETNRKIAHDSVALLQDQVAILKNQMQVVEQQAENNKKLADASIANQDKVQQQIADIQVAREKTALEHKAELAALKNDLYAAKYEIQELTDQLSQERIKTTDLATTQAALLQAKITIDDFGIKYRAVMDERDDLKNELAALRTRVEKLEEEQKRSMDTIADLEKVIADQKIALQQRDLEKAALEAKALQLQAEIDRLSGLLAQQSVADQAVAGDGNK